jgi:hypothetical protein
LQGEQRMRMDGLVGLEAFPLLEHELDEAFSRAVERARERGMSDRDIAE